MLQDADEVMEACFHPLKAGRRLVEAGWGYGLLWVSIPSRRVGDKTRGAGGCRGKKVSIPSRRVGDFDERGAIVLLDERFHPLKAGRRPRGNEGKGGQKKAKGREGCRRPSVGGKS